MYNKKENCKPSVYCMNHIVTEVNEEFLRLTNFTSDNMIGISLIELSKRLKMDAQINLEDINHERICYIFTKSFEAVQVKLIKEKKEDCNLSKIIFEVENCSTLNDKFEFAEQIYTKEKTGVSIYSYPDFILLKANHNYIKHLNEPYNNLENCIGLEIGSILTGYEADKITQLKYKIRNHQEAIYYENIEFQSKNRGISYWNISIIPIIIEGILKYTLFITLDVTEKFLLQKNLQDPTKTLDSIIQDIPDELTLLDEYYIQNEEKALLSIQNNSQNDKQIKLHKQHIKAVIDNISDEIVMVNKKGDYSILNKTLYSNCIFDHIEKNLNNSSSDASMMTIDGNLVTIDPTLFIKILRGDQINGYRLNLNYRGSIISREVSAIPIFSSTGEFKFAILVCHELGGKATEEENILIRAQNESLSKIIEKLELGFVRCSYPDFKIIDMNKQTYQAFTGEDPSDEALIQIKGKNIGKISRIDETLTIMNTIKNRIDNKDGMFMYIAQINEEKFVQCVIQPIYGRNHEVFEVVLVSVDITDEVISKNKMEEALQMQKELFANISHELKTPLTIISSANQLIESYIYKNSDVSICNKVAVKIEMIKENTNRMKKLIGNILELSKIESGFSKLRLTNVNIVSIVENIVQSIPENFKGKKLSIIFDTNTEEKIMAIDVDKIERAVLNLISNAIKFSDTESEIVVTVIDNEQYVNLSVKDNGIGIDKKNLDAIFERFEQVDRSFTRNAEGSGIGLSLVKSIVEMHEGKISVKSEVGKGSIFKMKLPVKIMNEVGSSRDNINTNILEMVNIELSDII